jgi:hypothetical protein
MENMAVTCKLQMPDIFKSSCPSDVSFLFAFAETQSKKLTSAEANLVEQLSNISYRIFYGIMTRFHHIRFCESGSGKKCHCKRKDKTGI